MKNPFQESAKEFFRTVIFTLLACLVTAIVMIIPAINQVTGVIDINWAVIWATCLVEFLAGVKVALVSAIDKYKHESTKALQIEDTGHFDGQSHGIVKV